MATIETAGALTRDAFCARFKVRMLARAGERFDDGSSIAEYADMTGPSYFEEQHLQGETPEACADADMSYWGDPVCDKNGAIARCAAVAQGLHGDQ